MQKERGMGGSTGVGGSSVALCLCKPSVRRQSSVVECHWPAPKGTVVEAHSPSLWAGSEQVRAIGHYSQPWRPTMTTNHDDQP